MTTFIRAFNAHAHSQQVRMKLQIRVKLQMRVKLGINFMRTYEGKCIRFEYMINNIIIYLIVPNTFTLIGLCEINP